jgi:hypothetical protein
MASSNWKSTLFVLRIYHSRCFHAVSYHFWFVCVSLSPFGSVPVWVGWWVGCRVFWTRKGKVTCLHITIPVVTPMICQTHVQDMR